MQVYLDEQRKEAHLSRAIKQAKSLSIRRMLAIDNQRQEACRVHAYVHMLALQLDSTMRPLV